jgi:hypothetical protein
VNVVEAADSIVVAGSAYRLRARRDAAVAQLEDADGEPWSELRLLAQLDTLDAVDETVQLSGPRVERHAEPGGSGAADPEVTLVWDFRSTRWSEKRLVFVCTEDDIAVHAVVRGSGRLTDVLLLSGAASLPGSAAAAFRSGARFATLFSPNPADPARIVQPATESATIEVAGGSEPGRGHWFFTPAPFCYAVARSIAADPMTPPDGPWLSWGLAAAAGTMTFAAFDYLAADRGFGFRLAYEGHTSVDGVFTTPHLLMRFGAADPYTALSAYRASLVARGVAAANARRNAEPWWLEPMFCGWGEQCHVARSRGEGLRGAASYSRRDLYDEWLATLEAKGVVPGTIVIDDRWQADYATNDPDDNRWPQLREWIAARHRRGQRVLLWWKAWDFGSLGDDACVQNAAGQRVALDPDRPAARETIVAAVKRMLSSDGLDADGLKIDFTARTPRGVTLTHAGPNWGVELLRRVLGTVHDAAKAAKPDCLLIGHTPNAAVDTFVDMIRLNDMLRLDDPPPYPAIVPQMRYRARVVRASSPHHPIDTDDWCAPDLASWRAYTALQPDLGVPALYHATHLDLTGEALEAADYELIRATWARYRRSVGLSDR